MNGAGKFKYSLMTGSKKFICPSCGEKTFTPYVYAGTNKIVDEKKWGRCDRANNCNYIKYPKLNDEYEQNWTPPAPAPIIAPIPDFVPKDVVESTFSNFRHNPFFLYLVKLFGVDTAFSLQEKYYIGTAKNNGTTFAQIDKNGNCRTIKVFYYDENGHRKKDIGSWYVHKKIKSDFNLVQVFFGEHLASENKPVYLVESEKTAIIMSAFYPDYTWIASGGAQMIDSYGDRILRLPRLDKIFPDQGMTELWKVKTKHLQGVTVDGRVEKAFLEGEISKGDDILDLELRERSLQLLTI